MSRKTSHVHGSLGRRQTVEMPVTASWAWQHLPVVSAHPSLKSSAFSAWSVLESPFSAGFSPSLPALVLPFFLLGTFSPNFAGAFLGLRSGHGGAGSAYNLAVLLWFKHHLVFISFNSPFSLSLGWRSKRNVAMVPWRSRGQSRFFFPQMKTWRRQGAPSLRWEELTESERRFSDECRKVCLRRHFFSECACSLYNSTMKRWSKWPKDLNRHYRKT